MEIKIKTRHNKTLHEKSSQITIQFIIVVKTDICFLVILEYDWLWIAGSPIRLFPGWNIGWAIAHVIASSHCTSGHELPS